MNETSLSLLAQLQESDEADSWARFARLYTPLITAWLRKYDVQNSDIDDLMQDVFLAVSKDLPRFERRGPGAFRGWMKGILVNRLRNFWRSRDRRPLAVAGSDIDARLAQLDDPTSQQTQIWNRQHDQIVMRQLLEMVKPQFESTTWKAFCRVALDGQKAQTVADELQISRNSVFLAKSRVLRRLRQEAEGLVAASTSFSGRG